MKVYLRPSMTAHGRWGVRWEVNGVTYDPLTIKEALILHERLTDYIHHWIRSNDDPQSQNIGYSNPAHSDGEDSRDGEL